MKRHQNFGVYNDIFNAPKKAKSEYACDKCSMITNDFYREICGHILCRKHYDNEDINTCQCIICKKLENAKECYECCTAKNKLTRCSGYNERLQCGKYICGKCENTYKCNSCDKFFCKNHVEKLHYCLFCSRENGNDLKKIKVLCINCNSPNSDNKFRVTFPYLANEIISIKNHFDPDISNRYYNKFTADLHEYKKFIEYIKGLDYKENDCLCQGHMKKFMFRTVDRQLFSNKSLQKKIQEFIETQINIYGKDKVQEILKKELK